MLHSPFIPAVFINSFIYVFISIYSFIYIFLHSSAFHVWVLPCTPALHAESTAEQLAAPRPSRRISARGNEDGREGGRLWQRGGWGGGGELKGSREQAGETGCGRKESSGVEGQEGMRERKNGRKKARKVWIEITTRAMIGLMRIGDFSSAIKLNQ